MCSSDLVGLDGSLWTLGQEEELLRDEAVAAEIEREVESEKTMVDVISLSSGDDDDDIVEIVPPRTRPLWPAGALKPAATPVVADLDAPGAMEVDDPIEDVGPDQDEAPRAQEPRRRPTRWGRCPRCMAACRLIPPTQRTHFRPLVGCSKFPACPGYLRAVQPWEYEALPRIFVVRSRLEF